MNLILCIVLCIIILIRYIKEKKKNNGYNFIDLLTSLFEEPFENMMTYINNIKESCKIFSENLKKKIEIVVYHGCPPIL